MRMRAPSSPSDMQTADTLGEILEEISVKALLDFRDLGDAAQVAQAIMLATLSLIAGVDANVKVTLSGLLKEAAWPQVHLVLSKPGHFLNALRRFPEAVDSGLVPDANASAAQRFLATVFPEELFDAHPVTGSLHRWSSLALTYCVNRIRALRHGAVQRAPPKPLPIARTNGPPESPVLGPVADAFPAQVRTRSYSAAALTEWVGSAECRDRGHVAPAGPQAALFAVNAGTAGTAAGPQPQANGPSEQVASGATALSAASPMSSPGRPPMKPSPSASPSSRARLEPSPSPSPSSRGSTQRVRPPRLSCSPTEGRRQSATQPRLRRLASSVSANSLHHARGPALGPSGRRFSGDCSAGPPQKSPSPSPSRTPVGSSSTRGPASPKRLSSAGPRSGGSSVPGVSARSPSPEVKGGVRSVARSARQPVPALGTAVLPGSLLQHVEAALAARHADARRPSGDSRSPGPCRVTSPSPPPLKSPAARATPKELRSTTPVMARSLSQTETRKFEEIRKEVNNLRLIESRLKWGMHREEARGRVAAERAATPDRRWRREQGAGGGLLLQDFYPDDPQSPAPSTSFVDFTRDGQSPSAASTSFQDFTREAHSAVFEFEGLGDSGGELAALGRVAADGLEQVKAETGQAREAVFGHAFAGRQRNAERREAERARLMSAPLRGDLAGRASAGPPQRSG